jgi:mannose-6-phosphate isomerase-like protein (cupin superfamily)
MTSLLSIPRPPAATDRWTGAQLAGLAIAAAADPRRWAHRVEFHETERFALQIERDDDHDLWLLSWLPGQQTGWHDHGGSTGAFAVARGAILERRIVAGRGGHEIRLGPGASRIVPDPVLHDVGNPYGTPAVSLHAYSPPLETMTYFDEHLAIAQVADVRVPGSRER